MIPHKIHQMWIDKKDINNIGPPSIYNYEPIMQTWKDHNPDYKYTFWNTQKVIELWDNPLLSKWKPLFDSIFPLRTSSIQRLMECADLSRYAVLYIHGGIYADLDVICFKNIDLLLNGRSFGWIPESTEHKNVNRKDIVCNSILLSEAGSNILRHLLDYIVDNYSSETGVMNNTGPYKLAKFIKKYGEKYPEILLSKIDICLLAPFIGNGDDRKSYFISQDCPNIDPNNVYTAILWKSGTKWSRRKEQEDNTTIPQQKFEDFVSKEKYCDAANNTAAKILGIIGLIVAIIFIVAIILFFIFLF